MKESKSEDDDEDGSQSEYEDVNSSYNETNKPEVLDMSGNDSFIYE